MSDLKTKGLKKSITARLVSHTFSRNLYNKVLPNTVTVNGYIMHIDKNDTIVSHYILENKAWEELSSSVMNSVIKSGDTVLDIGAHIGYYTLLASKRVGPHGKVYAFEPDPHNFSLLKKNIKTNNIKNVVLVNKAVGDKDTTTHFYLNPTNTGDNRTYKNDNPSKRITVQQIKLDGFITEPVHVIKMDIQGSELKALEGMKRLLAKNPYLTIFSEFWPEGLLNNNSDPKKLLQILNKNGYSVTIVDDKKMKKTKTTFDKLLRLVESKQLYDTNLLCTKS